MAKGKRSTAKKKTSKKASKKKAGGRSTRKKAAKKAKKSSAAKTRRTSRTKQSTKSATRGDQGKGAEPVDDRTIGKEIRAAMRSDSRISAGACKVEVENGRVELSGRVSNYRRKKDILDTVEEIRGVKAIDDKIQVKPASKAADDDLLEEVLKQLKSNPDIPATNISAVVKKGVVTLSGYVPSTPMWERVRDAALDVDGVSEVKNLVLVDPKVVRNDREVSKDVVRTLYTLDGIDPSGVKVSVVGGKVELSGKIDSLFSSKRAERAAARIRSVKQVVNKMKVK